MSLKTKPQLTGHTGLETFVFEKVVLTQKQVFGSEQPDTEKWHKRWKAHFILIICLDFGLFQWKVFHWKTHENPKKLSKSLKKNLSARIQLFKHRCSNGNVSFVGSGFVFNSIFYFGCQNSLSLLRLHSAVAHLHFG